MSRALALVGLFVLVAPAAAVPIDSSTPPADLQYYFQVNTSQTPPGAVDWWYRQVRTMAPTFITEFPTIWVGRNFNIPYNHMSLLFGTANGTPNQHELHMNFTPEESVLDSLSINIAPAAGTTFDITITSSAGVRTINRQARPGPEPSSLALAAIGLLALWRRR